MAGFELGELGDTFTSLGGDGVGSNFLISNAQARSGNYSLRKIALGNEWGVHTLANPREEIYIRVAIYYAGGSTTDYTSPQAWREFMRIRGADGNARMTFGFGPLEDHRFNRLVVTWAPGFGPIWLGPEHTPNTWACYEIYMKVGKPGGVMQVRKNGQEVISGTGDTKGLSEGNTIADVRFGASNVNTCMTGCWDDIAINDIYGNVNITWPGTGGIQAYMPVGDAEYTEWTPNTGANNYSRVNTVPVNDATYVDAATASLRDTYNVLRPEGSYHISAIKQVMRARLTAGSGQVAMLQRLYDIDYAQDPVTIDSTFRNFQRIYEELPGEAAINFYTLNDLEIGVISR